MKVESVFQSLEQRGLSQAVARRIVVAAIAAGSLNEIQSAPTLEETEVTGELPKVVLLEEIYRQLPEGIVATAPVVVPNTRPTLDVFQLIIAAAEVELLIASPYIDGEGVRLLSEPLAMAYERGVRIRLLTRETSRRQPGREAGIRRLAELVGQGLEVRDYHATVDGRHAAAVHAKLLMADESIGYVGSAEIRQHGLLSNFEMGYIFHRGLAAATARQAFTAFWEIASPVDEIL